MLLLFWFLQVTNDVIQSYVQAILSPDPRIESLLVQVGFLDITKLEPSFANNSSTNDFVQEEQLVLLDEKFHHKNMYEYVDSRQEKTSFQMWNWWTRTTLISLVNYVLLWWLSIF